MPEQWGDWVRSMPSYDEIELRARIERLEAALTNIQRRAWPHPDDTDSDRERNLFHIEAYARAALAEKEG